MTTIHRSSTLILLCVIVLQSHAFQQRLSSYCSIYNPQCWRVQREASSTNIMVFQSNSINDENNINVNINTNNNSSRNNDHTSLRDGRKRTVDCLQDTIERMHILQQQQKNSLPLLPKKFVRIGPSSIPGAGNGAFVDVESIPAGTIIGFYPVHCIGIERYDMNAIVTATEEDDKYFNTNGIIMDDNNNAVVMDDNLLLDLSDDRPIGGYQGIRGEFYIDVNPHRPILDPWISHYLNDGDVVKSNSDEGLSEYYKSSTERSNCFHIPFGPSPIYATITTRDVKKGEELFVTYGGPYWLHSLDDDVDDDNYDNYDLENFDEYDEEEPEVGMSDHVQQFIEQTVEHYLDAMEQAQVTHATLQANLERLFQTAKE